KKIDELISKLAKSFADVQVDTNAIRKDLNDLKTNTALDLQVALSRIATLERQAAELRLEMNGLKNGAIRAYPPDGKDRWAELKAEILAELRQYVAKSSPNQPVVTTADTGTMMVVNKYPETITVRVNGVDQGQ